MIQDISPYRLDMAYRGTVPAPDDCFFSFRGEDVLLRDMGDGCRSLPSFWDLGHPAGEMESRVVFLFRAGREPVYLLGQAVPGCRGLGKEVRAEDACLPGMREHGISRHRPGGNGGGHGRGQAVLYFVFSVALQLVPFKIECVIYLMIMFLVTNIATRTKGERMVNNVIICDLQAKNENEE